MDENDYAKDLPGFNLTGLVNWVRFNYRGGVLANWLLQHQYGYPNLHHYYETHMGRQLRTKIVVVGLGIIFAVFLWNYQCMVFHKKLDNTDIIALLESYLGEEKDLGGGVWDHRSPFIYVGVKNVCKESPGQYMNFLPKIGAMIADTTREEITIYFIMYDEKTAFRAHYLAPYRLIEEIPQKLLLKQHWACGKEPELTYWYIPKLHYLNHKPSYIDLPIKINELDRLNN